MINKKLIIKKRRRPPKKFSLSGDVLSGDVTKIMLQVITDCYTHYKESDPTVTLTTRNRILNTSQVDW